MTRPHDPSEPTPRTDPVPRSVQPPGRPADAPLGPAEETEVHRLLASARHTDPMPDDVVARLDGVLARLAAGDDPDLDASGELDPSDQGGTVVPLASRRRRARRLLLVAAAAVVAGVGAGQLVSEVPTADSDDSAASAEAEPGPADGNLLRDQQAGGGDSGSRRDLVAFQGRPPVPIGSETFADDVAALQPGPVETSAGVSGSSAQAEGGRGRYDSRGANDGPTAELSTDATWFECTPADWGAGRLVPVLYDGDAAVLVFRPRTGDSRVVELLQCGSGEVLRSLTVPTR